MSRYVPVDPEEAFHKFSREIWRALQGHDETLDYLLQRCREKDAKCMCTREGDLIIIELIPIRGTDKFSLMVWCGATINTDGGFEQRTEPELDRIASELGASRIEFTTNRAGFKRRLSDRWVISHVTYERASA